MIVYFDTSALVKLYVTEEYSQDVAGLLRSADIAATHEIAFVEANSAFGRLEREAHISQRDFECLTVQFEEDWENFLRVGVNPYLIKRASVLAVSLALRAYDAVHLSAADFIMRNYEDTVLFACFDMKLNRAAQALGLEVFSSTTDG
jgi:predicted nucleic acid-binding protein